MAQKWQRIQQRNERIKEEQKKERYRRLNICIYIYTIEMEQDYNKYIKCRSAHYRMNERHVEEMIEFET